MAGAERNLAVAVKAVADVARSELGPHPSPTELIEYQEGLLPADQESRVKDHLSLCPSCTQAILTLTAFPPPEASGLPEMEEDDEQVDRAWQRLKAAGAASATAPPGKRRDQGRRFPLPLAASILVGVLGLGLFTANLLRPAPSNFLIWQLLPADEEASHRASAEPSPVAPAVGGSALAVELDVPAGLAFETYRAVLLDAAGRELDRRAGLSVRDGKVTFLVPARLEKPRRGTFRLDGRLGGTWEEVATFPFRWEEDLGL
ncbi:MAG: zf-HC2 domain-containing protein [Acidobacteria bacterium]|nr:zf-HC2 domain-containing protein [Acidobacteriota bacterium]